MDARKWICGLTLGLTISIAGLGSAMEIVVSPAELAQEADYIFVGTVLAKQCRITEPAGLIVTDYVFDQTELINGNTLTFKASGTHYYLTIGGGTVGDKSMRISGAPSFAVGERVLLFVYKNEDRCLIPVVGAQQGALRIITDEETRVEYVTSYARFPVEDLSARSVQIGGRRVSGIRNGEVVLDVKAEETNHFRNVPPQPVDPRGDAIAPFKKSYGTGRPLTMQQFVNQLRDRVVGCPVPENRLRRGGVGTLVGDQHDPNARHPLPLGTLDAFPLWDTTTPGEIPSACLKGAALSACGYQDLPIIFEYPAASQWDLSHHASTLLGWNDYMPIFEACFDDGSDGRNGDNEIAGFIDSATLLSTWGYSWPPTRLGMCWYRWTGECGLIVESDIMLNAAYDWSWLLDSTLGTWTINIRQVLTHELGHSWGEMLGLNDETYDYDYPSVMHGYYYIIVENGVGIHFPDSYLIRVNYDDQTLVPALTDIGVESYYADNGLHNSTTDSDTYQAGDNITIRHVTVENIGTLPVYRPTIQFFLSTDRTITAEDIMLKSDYSWVNFPAGSYAVSDYTASIPNSTAAGTYYIGIIVPASGDNIDGNNSTSLYAPVTVTCVPSPPVITSVSSNLIREIDVNWRAMSGVDYYLIRRNSIEIARLTGNSYTDRNCEPDFLHFYQVVAANLCGGSNPSAAVSGSCFAKPLRLTQNHPNPFNPNTTLSYELPRPGHVVLAVYDVRGAHVATLVDEVQAAGEQREEWNGLDGSGAPMPSGVYFARLSTQAGVRTVKVVLAR